MINVNLVKVAEDETIVKGDYLLAITDKGLTTADRLYEVTAIDNLTGEVYFVNDALVTVSNKHFDMEAYRLYVTPKVSERGVREGSIVRFNRKVVDSFGDKVRKSEIAVIHEIEDLADGTLSYGIYGTDVTIVFVTDPTSFEVIGTITDETVLSEGQIVRADKKIVDPYGDKLKEGELAVVKFYHEENEICLSNRKGDTIVLDFEDFDGGYPLTIVGRLFEEDYE